MSKHTPGPWDTDERDHDEPLQNIKIKAGRHHTVCTVWIDDAPVRDFNAQQWANARLIAAAPDLLEALEGLLCWCQGYEADKLNPHAFSYIRSARAAIAKATGEQA